MDTIPAPAALDPDRVSQDDREDMTAEEHRSRAQLLDSALHESCGYAQQLWDDLARVRAYLYDLPPRPESFGDPEIARRAPFGPADDARWTAWTDALAEVTSVLCGPKGDNGYGGEQAREHARMLRVDPPAAPASEATPESETATEPTGSDTDGTHDKVDATRTDPVGPAAAAIPFAAGAAGAALVVVVQSLFRRRKR